MTFETGLIGSSGTVVVDRIRGSRARAFWQFLREKERARALGRGLELLRNADTGHYTQFFGRIGFDFFHKGIKISYFCSNLHGLLSNKPFSEF
jgi:hypothetical protein